jgi:hypothetical protein
MTAMIQHSVTVKPAVSKISQKILKMTVLLLGFPVDEEVVAVSMTVTARLVESTPTSK